MPRYVQSLKDDSPLAEGEHDGSDGATDLQDLKGYFIKMGINEDLVCYNTTQVTNGLITAVTHTTVTVDGVTWDNGDEYEIYCTGTKDSILGTFGIDRRYGRKVRADEIDEDGFRPEDRDLDEDWIGNERPFGPGQPRRG